MSLGAAALKVSGRPNAISREEVSMATLEAGTTPRVTTKRHQNTEWNTVDILTWENTVLQNHPAGREEREQESAMIRKNANIDPLRSASKATMQLNTNKRAHKGPSNSPRVEWEKTAGQPAQV